MSQVLATPKLDQVYTISACKALLSSCRVRSTMSANHSSRPRM